MTSDGLQQSAFEARAPRRSPSLADQAYEALRDWIVDGTLVPGRDLSETDLSRRFAISRTPLREAVQRLQEEGLLNASGPRGFSVPLLDTTLVAEVYGVRRALEVAAAFTARSIPREELTAMRARMTDIGRAIDNGNLAPFNESDFEFHDLFVRHCGNGLLIRHIDRLRGNVQRIINFAGQFQEHTEASFNEHMIILGALEAGDTRRTSRAVDDHITNVTHRLIAKLSR